MKLTIGTSRLNRLRSSRPGFIEGGVPPPNGGSRGVPPPNGGYSFYWRGVGEGGGGRLVGGDGGGRLVGGEGGGGRLVGDKRSTFPIKDDAGYIGYLTDYEDDMVSDGGCGRDGGRDGGSICSTVTRRRRELLASDSDVSFSNCMMMIITICGLLLLFLFAVSSWGVPPPRRL